MARPRTLSAPWERLIQATEQHYPSKPGLDTIREILEMSQSAFFRAARGYVKFPDEKRQALEVLCDMLDVPSPLGAAPVLARVKNLTPLRLLGEELAKGLPAASRTLDRLRDIYPQAQLLELAESENTPEPILRAVQVLLE